MILMTRTRVTFWSLSLSTENIFWVKLHSPTSQKMSSGQKPLRTYFNDVNPSVWLWSCYPKFIRMVNSTSEVECPTMPHFQFKSFCSEAQQNQLLCYPSSSSISLWSDSLSNLYITLVTFNKKKKKQKEHALNDCYCTYKNVCYPR